MSPRSSLINVPAVSVAISPSNALRRSPKPGAFEAQIFKTPRSLLTTSAVNASPSMSSAMIKSGLPDCATFSSSGRRSRRLEIFFSWINTRASSSWQTISAGRLMKYGEMYPLSNCMPSTKRTVVSVVLPSSTVITPSFPTFWRASASKLPIARSLLALIAPTCATSSGRSTFFAISINRPTAAATAFSMPRRTAIGLLPAATMRVPSRKIARASTVAVVVPSPAKSDVLEATSFTSFAPMFSKASSKSTSLLTVTPSLVTVGPPNDLSMMTLRPVGPMVTATAAASFSTPFSSLARALSSNSNCLGTSRYS